MSKKTMTPEEIETILSDPELNNQQKANYLRDDLSEDELHRLEMGWEDPKNLIIDNLDYDNIGEGIENEDGSITYSLSPQLKQKEPNENRTFYDNLAETLDKDTLSNIAQYINKECANDISARNDWINEIERTKKFLGFCIEDKIITDPSLLSKTFDTTLSSAIVRFYSVMRSEFLPNEGPAHIYDLNEQDDNFDYLSSLKDKINHYLTVTDKDYYKDFERGIMSLGLYGCMFKKVFFNQIGSPICRFISPEDFIINLDCIDILSSTRLTHVLHLTKKEILNNVNNGIWKNEGEFDFINKTDNSTELEDSAYESEGNTKDFYSTPSLFDFYESHIDLAVEEFENGFNPSSNPIAPKPYIVTMQPSTNKIVRIIKNWKENDDRFTRINYFIKYNYLPGFDSFGLGLARLIGTNAITLTMSLRQLMDAGAFQSFPGGFMQKTGSKQQETSFVLEPGQFQPLDTGGQPLSEFFMNLPYPGLSEPMMHLRESVIAQTKELASCSEISISDNAQNAPVGTTIAMLEVNQRIQSAIFKSFYMSLSQELQMIYEFLKESLEQSIPQNSQEPIVIIPVADPSLDSVSQKMAKADAVLKISSQFPELHKMRNVLSQVYKTLKINNINQILIDDEENNEPKPIDPVTENMDAMNQKPLKAFIAQDHDAHIVVHSEFVDNPAIKAHIMEHKAFQYLILMQRKMGIELPDGEMMEDIRVQNDIAMKAAEVASKQEEQHQSPPSEIDVALEEIKSKERIAQQKTESDALKVQVDFEMQKMKMESDRELSQFKMELTQIQTELNQYKIQLEQRKIESQQEIEQQKIDLQQASEMADKQVEESKIQLDVARHQLESQESVQDHEIEKAKLEIDLIKNNKGYIENDAL